METTTQTTPIQSYTRGGQWRGAGAMIHHMIKTKHGKNSTAQDNDNNYDYPTCGDCWCIPPDNNNDNSNSNCPDWSPVNTYPEELIAEYQELIPNVIYTLDCNPYHDASCTTQPPQQYIHEQAAVVCALKYTTPCSNNAYDMISYANWDDAVSDGAIVTHMGACGLCSTTADLAAYMNNPDLESDSIICVTKGLLLSYDSGMQCFMEDIGLTEECANIWLLDGFHTTQKCTERCLKEVIEFNGTVVPANGDPPECTLSDCLQCDEDESGGIFTMFAGRNRRRSCLLSSIVRGCGEFTEIVHTSPDCSNDNDAADNLGGAMFDTGDLS